MSFSPLVKPGTWYLAGPMSGIKGFNFPFFEYVAKVLRAQGWTIVSPVELDTPEIQAINRSSPDGKSMHTGLTWGQTLARDIEQVADKIDGIILLPDWNRSRGARLEAFVGILADKKFCIYYHDVEAVAPIPLGSVKRKLCAAMYGVVSNTDLDNWEHYLNE